MIGNDIVDLALAQKESNWKRKGFLDKIFTLQEQLFINLSNAINIAPNFFLVSILARLIANSGKSLISTNLSK